METDGLPTPRRHWAMLIITLGTLMGVLDGSIANVALPTIARDLQATPAGSIWIVNAYQMVLVVTLLPAASLGEILGYTRVYRAGLALFAAASLGCALSDSLATLVVARVLQGFGAAGLMGVGAALIRHTYPQALLGRGVGVNALVVGAGLAMGPAICAGVLAVASWPWLFAINVPLALAILTVARRYLPSDEPAARAFDWKGALLAAAAAGLLLLGLEGLTKDTTTGLAAAEIVVALIAGTLLFRRSLAQQHPLVPLDLLRVPNLRLSMLTAIATFTAYMVSAVSFPFVLQYGLGRSPAETGLLMAPWPIAMVATAPVAGRLADRFPAAILSGAGLLTMTAGLVALAFLPADPGAWDIGWRMALGGLGFAFFQSPNNRAIMLSAPRHRSGAAGGLLAVARLLGASTGATLAALLFRLNPGDHTAVRPMLVAAGFAAVAAVVSLARLGQPAAAPSGGLGRG
jgi:DHA2 family multidrug resistance protein-like MFS transporter